MKVYPEIKKYFQPSFMMFHKNVKKFNFHIYVKCVFNFFNKAVADDAVVIQDGGKLKYLYSFLIITQFFFL